MKKRLYEIPSDNLFWTCYMIDTFLNAWWLAVKISHNKNMEHLNNPTPEVVCSMMEWKQRLKRLHGWASKRWGVDHVGKMIYDREHYT